MSAIVSALALQAQAYTVAPMRATGAFARTYAPQMAVGLIYSTTTGNSHAKPEPSECQTGSGPDSFTSCHCLTLATSPDAAA